MSIVIVIANAPATGGATSVDSQVTRATVCEHVNDAVAKPKIASAAIEVLLPLGFAFVAILLFCCKSYLNVVLKGPEPDHSLS